MESHVVNEALALAEASGSLREAAQALRTHYAQLRVVVVDAFDMRDETPAAAGPTLTLYYGASDGHCWQVTSDPAQAAGFFLSEAHGHG